jgi:hypothetical protein
MTSLPNNFSGNKSGLVRSGGCFRLASTDQTAAKCAPLPLIRPGGRWVFVCQHEGGTGEPNIHCQEYPSTAVQSVSNVCLLARQVRVDCCNQTAAAALDAASLVHEPNP